MLFSTYSFSSYVTHSYTRHVFRGGLQLSKDILTSLKCSLFDYPMLSSGPFCDGAEDDNFDRMEKTYR